jgi:succinyl-diaminopimelate desuccinylase
MTDKEKVLKAIDGLKEEAIDLMRNLIAINSIGPDNDGPGEQGKAVFLADYLKHKGFSEIKNFPAPYNLREGVRERPNIIARWPGSASESENALWILSHMDVVPEGDLSQWRTNPFEAVVEAGKIYGRGSEDNLQGLVASILAARAFIASGVVPVRDLVLALVSDEETGSKYGLNYLLENHGELFHANHFYVLQDAGSKTMGKQVHASTPHLGKNAFKAAAYLITQLENLYAQFNHVDDVFDPPTSTFEPTKKQANVPNINTIPGEDIFYFDCRVLPCYQLKSVLEEVERMVKKVEKKFEVSVSVNCVQKEQAAPATSKEAPVVRALTKAVSEIYGVQAQPRGIGGGTVAALFRKKGFDTAVWATLDDKAHQPNEYCVIDNLIKDAKVFCLLALDKEVD